jgi:hypothetical protein
MLVPYENRFQNGAFLLFRKKRNKIQSLKDFYETADNSHSRV